MFARSSEKVARAVAGRPKLDRSQTVSSAKTGSTPGIERTDRKGKEHGRNVFQRIKDWAGAAPSGRPPGEIDWENGDYFMACTIKQLRELDNETINQVRVVKSYIGPTSTPDPEYQVYKRGIQEQKDEAIPLLAAESDRADFADIEDGAGTVDGLSTEGDGPVRVDTDVGAISTTPTVNTDDQVPAVLPVSTKSDREVVTAPAVETNFDIPTALTESTKNDHEAIPTAPTLATDHPTPTLPTESVNGEHESSMDTPPIKIIFQAPTYMMKPINSESSVTGTMAFPEYSNDLASSLLQESEDENKDGDVVEDIDRRAHIDEEHVTVFDPEEPAMDEFRLNPNRPDIDMTPEQITNYEDFVPIDFNQIGSRINHQTIYQDLARILGTRNYGIQVVGTNLPMTYDSMENMSDYYQMPLIERPEPLNSFRVPTDNDLEISLDHPSGPQRFTRIETTPDPFLPKQSQPPAFALILYLAGKGHTHRAIANKIATLDYRFLDNWDSRWFNGCRIPEHWEMNDKMVETIQRLCRIPDHWWEETFGRGRTISNSVRRAYDRWHETRNYNFVRLVIGNYLCLTAGTITPKVEAGLTKEFFEQVWPFGDSLRKCWK